MSIMGNRVVRVEDPLFLTAGATYTDDLVDERLNGAVHVTFVRSPFAHAKVSSIGVAEARSAAGVVAVYTSADLDLAPIPPMPMCPDILMRPLITDTPKFAGDIVAMVLTEERYQGQDAAELVDVDYEPLPAVVSLADAKAAKALVFQEAGSNVYAAFGEDRPADFFDGCEVVVRQEMTNQRVAPVPLETRAAAATWNDDGQLTVWCTNQGAQQAKGELAEWLRLPPEQLRIITPDVGGGFGAKIGADPEYALVAWASGLIGRPVRWTEDRSENLVGMVHGRGQQQVVTVGGRRDGTIEAYSIEIDGDAGAYPRIGVVLPALTMLMAPGVYAFAKVHARATVYGTNTTSTNPYRGAGRPEATAAVERAIDCFAAEIGMDPAEVRRRNFVPPFDTPHTTPSGATYDTGDYARALQTVLAAAGYDDLRAEQTRRRSSGEPLQLGIGVSAYVEVTGADTGGGMGETAELEVHPDGSATVLTGTSPHGQGHATAWAMLAHEQTGIPMERITVIHGDTDRIPKGIGTFGSRSLQHGGSAVRQAAVELVELARARAAALLEASPEDIELDLGNAGVKVRGTGTTMTFGELAQSEPLHVATRFDTSAPSFPFGAHVAVVEVDVETGATKVRRIVTVDDAGRILNPLLAEGQRHGGIAQGVAQAIFEEVRYDEEGNPLTANLATYAFPSPPDLPSFELVAMETPTPLNPMGAKGIGEAGTIGSTPAVHNAVVDAVSHLGVRHIDMPCTAEKVWRAIQTAATRGKKL